MLYDRKIKYFDYRKNNERIRNGGFVKMEVRGGICNLAFQISGLNLTDTFSKQIYMVGRDKEVLLCDVDFLGGRASKQLSLNTEHLGQQSGAGLAYEDLQAIRIPIAAGTELYCRIAEDNKAGDCMMRNYDTTNCMPEEVGSRGVEGDGRKTVDDMPGDMGASGFEAGGYEAKGFEASGFESGGYEARGFEAGSIKAESAKQKDTPAGDTTRESIKPEAANKKMFRATGGLRMLEEKWLQLAALYPRIRPFEDEREYLKLNPEDFVIFNSRFYKLVHNSFLLHGYYNYQHLILARVEQRGVPVYYIGVPGNFYDREKQVALMFGFESFECRTEPAGTGDYGYYMIRVEL